MVEAGESRAGQQQKQMQTFVSVFVNAKKMLRSDNKSAVQPYTFQVIYNTVSTVHGITAHSKVKHQYEVTLSWVSAFPCQHEAAYGDLTLPIPTVKVESGASISITLLLFAQFPPHSCQTDWPDKTAESGVWVCSSSSLVFVCVCIRLCIHVCAFLRLSVFFVGWQHFAQLRILSHALFEVKMWLPAAIERRQQLENKRAGGGATGRLPCFRLGLYFSREVLSWRLWWKDRWRGHEKEGRERLRDEKRGWRGGDRDGQTTEGCHQQHQAAERWTGEVAAGRCFGESLSGRLVRMDCICILTTKVRHSRECRWECLKRGKWLRRWEHMETGYDNVALKPQIIFIYKGSGFSLFYSFIRQWSCV